MLVEQAAEIWFRHLTRTRTKKEVERVIRLQLLPHLSGRPLAEVRKRDMIAAIDAQAVSSASNAHHLLSYSRRFFNWACARDLLDHSPCERVSGRLLIGPQAFRQRILDQRELAAIWNAAGEIGQFGTFVRLLLVTGQRRTEVAGMRWAEVQGRDTPHAIWVIPAARYKSGSDHRVPLSSLAIRLLRDLDRESALVFPSSVDGEHICGFSKGKARLDRMSGVEGWVLHDLRRTMRTRMAALGVADQIAELCLGHARKGLARVYDLHRYEDEMRDAFEQWAASVSLELCKRVRTTEGGLENICRIIR